MPYLEDLRPAGPVLSTPSECSVAPPASSECCVAPPASSTSVAAWVDTHAFLVFAVCMFWRTAGIFFSGLLRNIFAVSVGSSHFHYLTVLEVFSFRQVCVPQAFAGHLLVEDAFAFVHHEDSPCGHARRHQGDSG